MTWLWRTFFSVVSLAPLLGASVSGSVKLVDSRNPGVRRHRDFSGVVVWLQPLGTDPPAVHPRLKPATMLQKGKSFQPHVLAIPVGTSVDFPNLDPIFHNAFSNFSGQIFDIGLYPPGTSRTVRFDKPGIVRIFCNIHPTMSAVIAVLDSSWFAVSDAAGTFGIQDVPPGEYRLHVFHERAAQDRLNALDHRITVPAGGLALPEIVISETGYLPAPHKNKYGKDYPPVIDEQGGYLGVSK